MHLAPPIALEMAVHHASLPSTATCGVSSPAIGPEVSDDRCTMLFYRPIEVAVATEPHPYERVKAV